jgi:hypothetical protein
MLDCRPFVCASERKNWPSLSRQKRIHSIWCGPSSCRIRSPIFPPEGAES